MAIRPRLPIGRLALNFAVLLAVFQAAPLQAQPAAPASPGGLYRLTPQSSFEEGCFDPCMCIAHYYDSLMGTFRMTPGAPDPLFQVFDITEVNWFVPVLGLRVTGSGTYRIGGEFARMHQLQLTLLVADRESQSYDSGLLLGGAEFPAINLSIAMNSMICHDTVFHVQAKPVAAREATPFTLFGAGYLEGCFGMCDCPVAFRPVFGRVGLLKLNDTETGQDYAVLDIDWRTRLASDSAASDSTPVGGFGIYRVSAAEGTHRMILDLVEDGAGPTRFDSGIVPGGNGGVGANAGGGPRRIDIDVAANGFACYDRVYSVDARRRSKAGAYFQAIAPEPVPMPIEPAPVTPVP